MNALQSILELIEVPSSDVSEGTCALENGSLVWDDAGVRIVGERSRSTVELAGRDPWVMHVSRTHERVTNTFLQWLLRLPERELDVVTVQLRGGTAQAVTLSAYADGPHLVEGIPVLDRIGQRLPLDALLSLLETARAHGCPVASWEHAPDPAPSYGSPKSPRALAEEDWENRRLCEDGTCVGTIDTDSQRCWVCGRRGTLKT